MRSRPLGPGSPKSAEILERRLDFFRNIYSSILVTRHDSLPLHARLVGPGSPYHILIIFGSDIRAGAGILDPCTATGATVQGDLRPAKRRVRAKFENEIVVVLIVNMRWFATIMAGSQTLKFESKSFEIVHTRHDIN